MVFGNDHSPQSRGIRQVEEVSAEGRGPKKGQGFGLKILANFFAVEVSMKAEELNHVIRGDATGPHRKKSLWFG